MVKFSLGGALCGIAKFRTPATIIIIFKLVTKPNIGVRHLGTKVGKDGTPMEGKTKSGQTEGKEDKVGFTDQKGLWKQSA